MRRIALGLLVLLLGCGFAEAQTSTRLVPPAQTLVQGTCGSAVSGCVLSAKPTNFYGVYAECTAACWLMVFNSVAVPSNGATTAGIAANNMTECVDIPSGPGVRSITYPTYPVAYDTGVSVAISSTACATLTLSTVGFIKGTVGP